MRLEASAEVGRAASRRAWRRRRARLRHRHVGPRDARDHHGAARPALRGDQDQGSRPRSSFRPVRRRRAKSDPRAGADHRRDPRPRRPHHHSRLLRRREGAARGRAQGMGGARPDAGEIPRPGGLERSRRREGPARHRAGVVTADLRRQRHLGRLYRPGREDGDSGRSLGQDLVPPRRRPEAGEDPPGVPRLRPRAPAGRLPRRVRRRRPCRARDLARLEHAAARRGARGVDRGVGQGGGADRLRRIDPDRRRLQAPARPRHAPDRLRPRRRSHSLAQREIRPHELPQGHAKLGADSRGARQGERFTVTSP